MAARRLDDRGKSALWPLVAPTYRFGTYLLEPGEQRLWRDGRPVRMHGKALRVLEVLVSRAGRLVRREDLLQIVWPSSAVEDSNITVHISALRRELHEIPDAIETVARFGYRFTAPVVTITPQVDGHPSGPQLDSRRARLLLPKRSA